MEFSSKIFTGNTPVKKTEEGAEISRQKQKMTDGYPVTVTPFIPEALKHTTVSTKFTSNGCPTLGYAFSSEKSNFVSIECLEMIRKNLLEIFVNHPEIMKELQEPIPRNTIAVSFTEANFQLGETCQDFLPVKEFKVPKNAFFTYQKLSENLQATYYNENGIQFLAGICYYPEPCGKHIYSKNDEALIIFARSAAEPYPLQDREKTFNKMNNHRYGRDCRTAGKRVWVDCSRKNVIRHVEYNHFSNKWTYRPCDECMKDAVTYKYDEPKEEDPKPATPSKPSQDTVADSGLSTAQSEKKQEAEQLNLTTVIKFLEMVGIQTPKLSMLGNLPNNAKIPMINKITKETLPESKCPQVKDLTAFMMFNSDWCFDFSTLKNETEKSENAASAIPDSPTSSTTIINLETMSPASSTENLLEGFDKLEVTAEYDDEFNAELVN